MLKELEIVEQKYDLVIGLEVHAQLNTRCKLMSPAQNEISNLPSGQDQTMGLKINLACLKSPDCLKQQVTAVKYTDAIKGEYGVVAESRFTHIIPWSIEKLQKQKVTSVPEEAGLLGRAPMPSPKLAPNEYMLHSYVRFSHVPNAAPDWLGPWFHLNIIVTEDSGEIQLQRFFLYQMPDYNSDLPPSVLCWFQSIILTRHS